MKHLTKRVPLLLALALPALTLALPGVATARVLVVAGNKAQAALASVEKSGVTVDRCREWLQQ